MTIVFFILFRVAVMDREPDAGAPRTRFDCVVALRKPVFWYR